MRRTVRLAWVLTTLATPACRPDLLASGSSVQSTRILAVRGEPPESVPGHAVVYRALIAEPEPGTESSLLWSFCEAPKPLTENDVVASSCLKVQAGAAGAGLTITATTPSDACQRFGPDPPPGMLRPRDPDGTGGYYQPLVLTRGIETAVALERIVCNLAQAPTDVAAAYRGQYTPNRNPKIAAFRASPSAGGVLELEVEWTPESKETYLAYDLASGSLVTRRESLTVSWFASGGALEVARTGSGSEDGASMASNVLRPTGGSSESPLIWVVLRDDRGGVDFVAYP